MAEMPAGGAEFGMRLDPEIILRQIVEQGGRDEIFGAPKQAYTKRLLTSVPQMDPEWLTEARARERSLREAE